jgi:cell division protein FtsL
MTKKKKLKVLRKKIKKLSSLKILLIILILLVLFFSIQLMSQTTPSTPIILNTGETNFVVGQVLKPGVVQITVR